MRHIKFTLIAVLLGFLGISHAEDYSNPCGALLCILGGQTSGECKGYYNYYAYELPKSCKGNAACIATKQLSHLKNCKTNSSDTPMDAADQADIDTFVTTTASAGTAQCTAAELNAQVQGKLSNGKIVDSWSYRVKPSYYRTSTNLTTACKAHANSKFSNLKITYTCDSRFYASDDWNKGYESKEISKTSYDILADKDKFIVYEYKKLNLTKYPYNNKYQNQADKNLWDSLSDNDKRIRYETSTDDDGYTIKIPIYEQIITHYYQKIYIKKDCWIVENKE